MNKEIQNRFLEDEAYVRVDGLHNPDQDARADILAKINQAWLKNLYDETTRLIQEWRKRWNDLPPLLQEILARIPGLKFLQQCIDHEKKMLDAWNSRNVKEFSLLRDKVLKVPAIPNDDDKAKVIAQINLIEARSRTIFQQWCEFLDNEIRKLSVGDDKSVDSAENKLKEFKLLVRSAPVFNPQIVQLVDLIEFARERLEIERLLSICKEHKKDLAWAWEKKDIDFFLKLTANPAGLNSSDIHRNDAVKAAVTELKHHYKSMAKVWVPDLTDQIISFTRGAFPEVNSAKVMLASLKVLIDIAGAVASIPVELNKLIEAALKRLEIERILALCNKQKKELSRVWEGKDISSFLLLSPVPKGVDPTADCHNEDTKSALTELLDQYLFISNAWVTHIANQIRSLSAGGAEDIESARKDIATLKAVVLCAKADPCVIAEMTKLIFSGELRLAFEKAKAQRIKSHWAAMEKTCIGILEKDPNNPEAIELIEAARRQICISRHIAKIIKSYYDADFPRCASICEDGVVPSHYRFDFDGFRGTRVELKNHVLNLEQKFCDLLKEIYAAIARGRYHEAAMLSTAASAIKPKSGAVKSLNEKILIGRRRQIMARAAIGVAALIVLTIAGNYILGWVRLRQDEALYRSIIGSTDFAAAAKTAQDLSISYKPAEQYLKVLRSFENANRSMNSLMRIPNMKSRQVFKNLMKLDEDAYAALVAKNWNIAHSGYLRLAKECQLEEDRALRIGVVGVPCSTVELTDDSGMLMKYEIPASGQLPVMCAGLFADIVVSHPDYLDYTRRVIESERNVLVSALMYKKPGFVKFVSPAIVDIEIDGIQTVSSDRGSTAISAGNHSFAVSAAGFRQINYSLNIFPNQTNEVIVPELEAKHGGIVLNLRIPEGLPVSSFEVLASYLSIGTATFSNVMFPFSLGNLAEGFHQLRLSIPGYGCSNPGEAMVMDGVVSRIVIDAFPSNSSVAFANNLLGFSVSDCSDNTIYSDSKLSLLPFVPHVLAFNAPGYNEKRLRIVLPKPGVDYGNIEISLVKSNEAREPEKTQSSKSQEMKKSLWGKLFTTKEPSSVIVEEKE